ncbi:purine permease [Puteibacter caeruleilacunae]|nr:purine permease [Puteibacter caeruleilacunae]
MDKQENHELIYKLEDKPRFAEAAFAALQHLLAIFVAIITPPLIIARALQLDIETTSFLVSMALFASGVSTFIQSRKIGPVGAGLLCVQGTSFSFISPIIAAGFQGGLPLIFGTCIAASSIEILLSRFLKYARKIISPLVSGIVVTMIGLSLVKVGIVACGGGFGAMEDGSFGSLRNLGVALGVLLLIVVLNLSKNKYIRMSSIFIGLLVGYIFYAVTGAINFSGINELGTITIPIPFKYGLDFSWSAFAAIGFVYIITAIESIGDITANSTISKEPVEGEVYMNRLSGGVLADGINSGIAGIFNSFPNSIFSQNNGLIQLTGVASRYVGYFIAVLLLILGLFPVVGHVFSLMPEPVLGGATLLMFGTVAVAGIKIIATQEIDRRAMVVLAISFSLGLGVELMPDILKHFPEALKNIFSSGITTGGTAAIISNIFFNLTKEDN